MKNHLSKVVIGFLGVCVGFALCYFFGITPAQSLAEGKASAVTIARDGSLYLGDANVGLSELSASLKKQTTHDYTITIFADKNTDYNRLVEVVDACKDAGVSSIAMRTSAAQEGKALPSEIGPHRHEDYRR